jgi:predicted nucleotidyltransferase
VIKLPEEMRKALDKIVREMRVKENVEGISLFGSWSRGYAASSSDVDLIILDKENFAYEYVERVHVGGFFIDLDHVPSDRQVLQFTREG